MKSVLVTGATGGIGTAICRLFLNKGWRVLALDISEKGFVGNDLFQHENCRRLVADICYPLLLKNTIGNAMVQLPEGLDLLVNNAGIIAVGEFGQLPLDRQLAIVDVNLKGAISTTHICLPFLKKKPQSAIINICSASALFGNPELTVYAATKAAIASFTEGLNIALEKDGIHVSAIWPIYVKTRMVTDYLDNYQSLKAENVTLTAEDVAKKVWKAYHSNNKIHWMVGRDTKLFFQLKRLLPTKALKRILKKTIGYQ